jgi:hypothetical protein
MYVEIDLEEWLDEHGFPSLMFFLFPLFPASFAGLYVGIGGVIGAVPGNAEFLLFSSVVALVFVRIYTGAVADRLVAVVSFSFFE